MPEDTPPDECLICRKQGGDFIHGFFLGHGVPHLHIHLLPRYLGTPRAYWGVRVDEWPEASRGDVQQFCALCDRLRAFLREEGNA